MALTAERSCGVNGIQSQQGDAWETHRLQPQPKPTLPASRGIRRAQQQWPNLSVVPEKRKTCHIESQLCHTLHTPAQKACPLKPAVTLRSDAWRPRSGARSNAHMLKETKTLRMRLWVALRWPEKEAVLSSCNTLSFRKTVFPAARKSYKLRQRGREARPGTTQPSCCPSPALSPVNTSDGGSWLHVKSRTRGRRRGSTG